MTALLETVCSTAAFAVPTLAERWVDEHGDHLYRFAVSRLHDPATAEDLVQETLLAAIRSRSSFADRSTVRTWLIGILKHKIADHYRHMFRTPSLANSVQLDESDAVYFDSNGHWNSANDAVAEFEKAELVSHLRMAINGLPKRLGIAYKLREIEGLSTEEICGLLHISPNNLHLLLHRARLRLRELMTRGSN